MKRPALLCFLCVLLFPATAPAVLDTNDNGLSDLWERQHNDDELFDEAFNPWDDPDHDRWTNAEEAAAGTDPFDPNPPDGLVRPATTHTPAVYGEPDGEGNPTLVSPEIVTVSWPTTAGKQYTLLVSADLTAQSWLPVEDSFIATGSTVQFHFQTDTTERLFWRVAVCDTDTDGDGLTDAEERSLGSSVYFADTDGNGVPDLDQIIDGSHPAGDGTDKDGDGIPDNELYSVVFELIQEGHEVPEDVGFEALDSPDRATRYLTNTFTDEYSIHGSPVYPDLQHGERRTVSTYLNNGVLNENAQPTSTVTGQFFGTWKSANYQPLGEGATLETDTPQEVVHPPVITSTERVETTSTTQTWRIKVDGTVTSSGTETTVETKRTQVSDPTTYPQFWDQHVKARPWTPSAPVEFGPFENVDHNRAVSGDVAAAEYIRERFRNHDFTISGTVSNPGKLWDSGSDTRILSLRWHWVKFDPIDPFEEGGYATPPAVARARFNLLVTNHDYREDKLNPSAPPISDQDEVSGIVGIECAGTVVGSQEVDLGEVQEHQIDAPEDIEQYDFQTRGSTHVHFDSLPVEVVIPRIDSSGNEVTGELTMADELKVSKMEQSLTVLKNAGEIISEELDIDKDVSRFYVRIPGGAVVSNQEEVSVVLQTAENATARYNDNETEIKLFIDGANLVSSSLILASDVVDDEFSGDLQIGADDQGDDRTHIVQLGGKVIISKIKIGSIEHDLDLKKTVQKVKKVMVNFVILDDGNVNVQEMSSTITRDIEAANERFAQVGIEIVKKNEVVRTVPVGLDLPEGELDVDAQDGSLSDDVRRIIEEYGTKGDLSDIHVFYVPFVLAGGFGSELDGVGLNSFFNQPQDAGYLSNIFMVKSDWVFAFAHEVGHILTDRGHVSVMDYVDSPSYQEKVRLNLMFDVITANGRISDTKRLFETQENEMQSSPHAKDP